MFGIVLAIVLAVLTYRTAKSNGYNALGWTLASLAVCIGVPVLIWFSTGFTFAALYGAETAEAMLMDYALVLTLGSLAASIGSVMLILRKVNTIRDDDEYMDSPPPPGQLGL